MSCEYSVPYPGIQSAVSANGAFVTAVTAGNRLAVRNCNSLEVSNIFQCVDKIDKVEISPDSCYILCALYSRNVIQVFSIEDKDWKCRINEGVAGMTNAYWTPDSRNVVVESDFGIQVSIWSLTDSNSVIISLPKPAHSVYSKTSAFSDCGRFYALVHRIDLQDQIGVYTVASQTSLGMSEISKFRARSSDVASIYWVPGGTHLVTMDSPLTYKFCAYTPMGECLATYEAYQNALGIRSVAICKPLPSYASTATTPNTTAAASVAVPCVENKFIALGSFDGKVRLLSMYSWQLAFALPLLHPRELDAGFNSARLLLTVEVASSASTTRFGGSGGSGGVEDNEEDHENLGEEGAVPPVKQHQVPPVRQVLRSVPYIPNRIRGVMLDRDGNAIQTTSSSAGGDSGSGSGSGGVVNNVNNTRSTRAAEEDEEAREHALLASMESHFVLKSVKALPRAQAFQLEGKRNNTSTLTSTRRTGGAGTGAGGSSGGIGGGGASTSTLVGHSSGHSSGGSGGFPAVGVSWVGWSSNSQLLAAREEAHPRCLWVWRPLQAQLLAVLVLLEPVTCARWRPLPTCAGAGGVRVVEGEETEVLAFCTGTSRVYFWTAASGVTFTDTHHLNAEDKVVEGGASEAAQGQSQGLGFAVTSLLWAKDGRSLVLRGKEVHAICKVALPTLQHHPRR